MIIAELKKFLPVQNHNRQYRSELYRYFKYFCKIIISYTKKRTGDHHVTGRGNRKEFGQAFNNGNDDCFKNRHSDYKLFFGRLKIATTSITRPARIMMGAIVILLKLYTWL